MVSEQSFRDDSTGPRELKYRIIDKNSDDAIGARICEDLHFDAQLGKEGRRTFYFTNPVVKLGDGTFGAVFEIRSGAESYALKILYKESASGTAQEQFRREANISEMIKVLLREFNLKDEYYTGLVEIIGQTANFLESMAGRQLKPCFDRLNVPLTNFALIMPFYKYTLKDLLEKCIDAKGRLSAPDISRSSGIDAEAPVPKGGPAAENVGNHADQSPKEGGQTSGKRVGSGIGDRMPNESAGYGRTWWNPTGYEILAEQSFDDRISTMMPYLRRIAGGLCALHAARLTHLDIKPANIFVNEAGNEIDVVLGDLGTTVTTPVINGTQTMRPPQDRPLGTRHYRSPEQKDYFDVAYVRVEPDGQGKATLIVNDPKFMDSIIEGDDYVEFSKAPGYYHRIEAIKDEEAGGRTERRVMQVELRGLDSVAADAYTQAFFHKRQHVRTDLFGLGAICFDMVTAGESPERFYDHIRGHDEEGQDVSDIVDQYGRVVTVGAADSSTRNIFEVFRHRRGDTYAPPEIVEFILKCMLYKAGGTFYKQGANSRKSDSKPPSLAAVEAARNHIDNELALTWRFNFLENVLLHRPKQMKSPVSADNLRGRLERWRREQCLSLRLAVSIWYLRRLSDLVVDQINQGVFVEMEPENLDLRRAQIVPLGKPYRDMYSVDSQYYKDIRSNRVEQRISRDVSNPFVPKYFQTMRRPIKLVRDEAGGVEHDKFKCIFLDDPPYWNGIEKGDWISSGKNLFYISELCEGSVRLLGIDVAAQTVENAAAFLYKNLDLSRYYSYMIAAYLHQIVFAGLLDIPIAEPRIINCVEQWPDGPEKPKLLGQKLGSGIMQHLHRALEGTTDSVNRECEEVLEKCVKLYVSLRVWEVAQLSYERVQTKVDRPTSFREILSLNQIKWQSAGKVMKERVRGFADDVSGLTGIGAATLEDGIEDDKDAIESLTKKYGQLNFDNVKYDRMIRATMSKSL